MDTKRIVMSIEERGPMIAINEGRKYFSIYCKEIEWDKKNVFVLPKHIKRIGPSFFTSFFEKYTKKNSTNSLSWPEINNMFDFVSEEPENNKIHEQFVFYIRSCEN